MRSPKQIAASRTNGALSHGPVTDEGKAISSRNGISHGLLARTVVLAEESEERFLVLLGAYKRDFRPRNSFEISLVETMVVARWRLLRIWGAEKTSLDRDMQLQDQDLPPSVRVVPALKGTPDTSCPPDLFRRYEVSLDRQYSRAAKLLMQHKSLPIPEAEPYYPDTLPGHVWPDTVEPKKQEQPDPVEQPNAVEQPDAVEQPNAVEQPEPVEQPDRVEHTPVPEPEAVPESPAVPESDAVPPHQVPNPLLKSPTTNRTQELPENNPPSEFTQPSEALATLSGSGASQ